jgi:hypothetical protein
MHEALASAAAELSLLELEYDSVAKAVEECVALAVQAARAAVELGTTKAMNEFNRRR